jgi:hypothetical protein
MLVADGWSEAPPSWAVPVTVAGELVLVRRADVLAYIGPVCAYPTGFLFSLTIAAAPGGSGDSMIGLCVREGRRPGPVLRVQARFGDVTVDSAARGTGRAAAGQPLLRDWGASATGRVGHPHPRSAGRWWVSPLPPAGPVEFAVFLPGEAEQSGAGRMDAGPIIAAAGRSAVLWAEPG